MKRTTVIASLAALTLTPAAALAATSAPATAAPASTSAAAAAAQTREVEGTVVSVDRDTRSFRLRDEGRTVRVRVTSRTRYERLSGFGALRVGMRDVEAIVRRVDGAWVATEVERSGRSDDRGGDDDSGRDDDSRSGRDDDSGRGRGRGSDD